MRHVAIADNVPLANESEASSGHLVISINDIISLKKEGMSFVGRLLTSWALDAEGAGGTGLETGIIRRHGALLSDVGAQGTEETIKLRSVVRRDELFGRLLALGEQ